MGYIISIYGEKALKKILLPVTNNADYHVILYKDLFGLRKDMLLEMEIVNGQWYFKQSKTYTLFANGEDYFEKVVKHHDIIQLQTKYRENLTILVSAIDTPFEVYRKYSLRNLKKITIGKGLNNHIQYDYFGMVSTEHAILEITPQGSRIHDLSSNGIFVNNMRVKQSQILKFGDSIQILGLQIIYLGELIAVEQTPLVAIDSFVLQEVKEDQIENFCGKYDKGQREKKFFHRTPRNIEKIDEEAVEIEEAPAPAKIKRQSMILAIGPAFSMAIPMVLGSMFSIYGAGNSSVFLYAGLITALSSALIGTIWAVANVRAAKKEALQEEDKRKKAYVEYLEKTMTSVKEKYEKNSKILHARYPETRVCISYGKDTSMLWNRNQYHADFLYHRLGLGRIPFQASIQIPKERFRIEKDELRTKPKDIQAAYEILKDVPVGLDFAEHRLVGIVGGNAKKGAFCIARNLLIQIAANNCYTDVKLAVIYRKENGYESDILKCAKWIPHVWSEDKKTRYVADNSADACDVFYELAKVFRSREEESSVQNSGCLPRPYYVLLVADPCYLEDEMIAKYVFSDNKAYGLSTILLTENYEELPNRCEYIIQNDEEFQGYYCVTDDISDRVPVRFDETSQNEFEQFARRLSDIEVNETEKGGEIPSVLTFFEMLGISSLEQLNVLDNWRKNRTFESMKVVVGRKSGGAPCYLDIHEKYHGPHGLVAGTTGSGKSETLQTYILSLAVNFSPDDVGFFVIDYKGGGMANLFSNLPHTIGQISNLSGNQVHRAMVSIKSENRRRQRIFSEHGVNNINNYTRLYKNSEASVPIPHLFIIIDEFAELKREEPDFMRELISVAQVGRSLGVHLILATQKPSGTVDDNIWSNAKFRLCLRVQDRQDSNDMLHKPDAAYITQAGRCYLQVGNDEIYELFQSGWSGAPYDEADDGNKMNIAKMFSISGKAALVGNRMKMKQKEQQRKLWILLIVRTIRKITKEEPDVFERILADPVAEHHFMELVFENISAQNVDYPFNEYNLRRMEELIFLYKQALNCRISNEEDQAEYILNQAIVQGNKIPELKEKTQLDAVVEYLAVLAKKNGYTNRFMLWMPVLPDTLYLHELKGYTKNSFNGIQWPQREAMWNLEAFIGLMDDPVNQAQMPLVINMSEGGSIAVCGTVMSGKSTFLQSFVYSMTHSYAPDYVNFYLLDFSSHMLSAFSELAHVGGVIFENEEERLAKFFNMMEEIIEERKLLLQGGNYAQYVQTNGIEIPAIIIVIDQFSNFQEKTGGIYEDALIRLSRNGAGYGIYLVLTSAGFGINEIPGRIGDNIRTTLSLEMSDKYQYADILHTLRVNVYPEEGVKGRGLVSYNGEVLEFQTALCLEAEDDYTRTRKIEEECRIMNRMWSGKGARKIPEIPEKPILADFLELEKVQQYLEDPYHLPLGYNQENASVFSIDLREIFCWIVQGRAHTGKTNVLKILMSMAVRKGGNVAVIDFKGTMKSAADKQGACYLNTEKDIVEYLRKMLPEIQKRNAIRKQATEEELDESEVYDRMCQEMGYYLFIDSMEDFIRCVYHPSTPEMDMRGFLENITEKGRLYQIFIFAGCNPDLISETAGFTLFENMVRSKRGIHLGGNTASQRIMDFSYLSYDEQNRARKPGIGFLPAIDGEVREKSIVIPRDRRSR